MGTPRALRSGTSPPVAVPASGRSLLRGLAVLALIAGIVAMHSLGLGHGPMASGPAMTGMTETTGTAAGAVPHAMTTATAIAIDVVAEAADPGHGMAAMCLAVLPLLVLLVARLLGWRVRSLTSVVRPPGLHGVVHGTRAPPSHLRPSLLKLCILRT